MNQKVTLQRAALPFIFLILFYFIFYGTIVVILYSLITLNTIMLAIFAIIGILQIPIGRTKLFTETVKKWMHPSQFFKSWTFINDTEDPPKQQKCIYAFHPHSVYAAGLLCSMNNSASKDFCDMVGISSNFVLNVPVVGLFFRMWGVSSASNDNIKHLMSQDKKIGLLPGGFQQATITSQNQLKCWVSRKGFIKYSLMYGYDIIPVVVLRQHQGFWTFQGLEKLRIQMNKLKVPGVLFWSKTGIILPPSLQIIVIKGRTLTCKFEKNQINSEPSQQLIDQTHAWYVEEVERLYSKYRNLNGDKPLKFY